MPGKGPWLADGIVRRRRSRWRCSQRDAHPLPGPRRGGAAAGADLPGLMARVDRVLVCSSPSYDFGSGSVPAMCRYVGPQLDDDPGEGSGEWRAGSAGPAAGAGGPEQHRHAPGGPAAAGGRRARAGPGARARHHRPGGRPGLISARRTRTVTRRVRHADALPHCSAVITHGGHGTVMKALIAGVPLIGAPRARPARYNAGRVVYAGVGIRAAQEGYCQRAAGDHQPGHRRSPRHTTPPPSTWRPGWLPASTTTSLSMSWSGCWPVVALSASSPRGGQHRASAACAGWAW